MQPVFQQNSQRRSVRHAELLAVRARVSSQRPFLTGGGFLVLVISCGRDAAKLFPQFPGTGCFLPLAVSYRRPFPVAGRFLRLAHHPILSVVQHLLSEIQMPPIALCTEPHCTGRTIQKNSLRLSTAILRPLSRLDDSHSTADGWAADI